MIPLVNFDDTLGEIQTIRTKEKDYETIATTIIVNLQRSLLNLKDISEVKNFLYKVKVEKGMLRYNLLKLKFNIILNLNNKLYSACKNMIYNMD